MSLEVFQRKGRTIRKILSYLFFKRAIKKQGILIGKNLKGYSTAWKNGLISVGKNVSIGQFAHFSINRKSNFDRPLVSIGDGTKIRDFFQLACNRRIIIDQNVLIANNVFIGDSDHIFLNIDIPISKQVNDDENSSQARTVIIGKNTWIGRGACILKGVQIGKNCVIGANSVMTKSIPDYSVAVGNPAQVIKQYNNNTMQWETIK